MTYLTLVLAGILATGSLAMPLNNEPEPPPVVIQYKTKVDDFVDAIINYEGFYEGSRGHRNNNPGNLRYANQSNAIGKDDKNFAIFRTYEDGRNALKNLIERGRSGLSTVYKPDMTIAQFFHVYAPTNDSNNPDAYAKHVAQSIGLSIETKIKDI